jgi:type III restriction enzyme
LDRPRPRAPAAALLLQVEAVETAIYLTEAASKFNDAWIANELREFADDANPGLLRIALKMATGTGKTVVMGMLIAWQTLKCRDTPPSH